MSRPRPALVTAVLSAAAVVGYLTYRAVAPDPVPPSEGVSSGDTEAAQPTRALADRLPDFALGNLAGDPQPITSWPGKPLLINFWATWCAPCLREIPLLKELQSSSETLQVVGIAVDRRDLVVPFAEKMQFNYPILIGQSDAWEAAGAFGVDFYALPFTVFTGPDGALLGVHTGELHAEHLERLTATLDDLRAGNIDVTAARARLAQNL
jgi:thiol-disulfide isomerase/thioredoxin